MKYLSIVVACIVACVGLAAEPIAELKPKTFRFESAQAPLGQVLTELAKQTGITVVPDGAIKDRPLAVSSKDLPFWAALDQIAKAADADMRFDEKIGKLTLVSGEKTKYRAIPLSVDGVFRIAARSVESGIHFESGQRPTQVELSVSWEPNIVMFFIGPFDKSLTVRDDQGRPLQVVAPVAGRRPYTGPEVGPVVELENVPRDAKSIAVLQGHFPVVVTTKLLEFEFARPVAAKDATEMKSQTQDGVTVRLNSDFKEDSELWTARVELEYPKDGPKFESFELGSLLQANNAWLTNAAVPGVMRHTDYEVVSQGRVTTLKYRFQNPMRALGKPEDWTLHVRTPSRFIETNVQVKLANIPLP